MWATLNKLMSYKWFISMAAIFMLAAPLSGHVAAQDTSPQPTQAELEAAALKAREAAEARVDAEMVQMSDLTEALVKNLGQLHALRQLCYGIDNQYWRDYAGQLLQIEAGSDLARREYLTRAFNAGFFQEQERFKNCSVDVSVDAAAIAENGRRLASMLGDPHRDN